VEFITMLNAETNESNTLLMLQTTQYNFGLFADTLINTETILAKIDRNNVLLRCMGGAAVP